MGILSWILLGLIVGALAKWLMPGEDGGGIFITMGLDIAGGYVGSLLGVGKTGGLSLTSIVTATAGAFVLLFIYRQVKKLKSSDESSSS